MARSPESSSAPRPAGATPDFHALYHAEFSYLWDVLRRFGVPPRDLEDLVQDVFMKVFRGLKDYDPSRPLRPWLCGIAFRTASDYRRSARSACERLDPDPDPPSGEPAADERIETREAHELATAALDTLDLERRAVFVMHELDGRSMPEIAGALSIPLNTGYSRLRLAREQFNDAVRRMRRARGRP